jgi:hypothetical protein
MNYFSKGLLRKEAKYASLLVIKQGCSKRGASALPVLGQTVNPISTREQIMPTTVLRASPDYPRTAKEMDGTLHTDFRKSETSRDIKKYF